MDFSDLKKFANSYPAASNLKSIFSNTRKFVSYIRTENFPKQNTISVLHNRQWIWTFVNLISGQTKVPKKFFSQCPIWKGETRCENGPEKLQSFGNKSCRSNQKCPVWRQIYSKVRFFFLYRKPFSFKSSSQRRKVCS